MSRVSIAVVDDDLETIACIKSNLKSKNIEVLYSAYDGIEGYSVLKEHVNDYDLAIIDIVMPKMDGLEMLKQLRNEGYNKKVIVLTSYNSPDMIRKISNLGCSYYMLKPFDISNLYNKIIECFDNDIFHEGVVDLYQNNLSISINNILHSLGVASNLKGYKYLFDAINFVYKNPNINGKVTKELYPMIAKDNDTTVFRVERAIRHAIETSWNRGDYELLEKLFGNSVGFDSDRATNSSYIMTVAEALRLNICSSTR